MAWMKIDPVGDYFLSGEFTWREFTPNDVPGKTPTPGRTPVPFAYLQNISNGLGFWATPNLSNAIEEEKARVSANRAALIAEIAAAVAANP